MGLCEYLRDAADHGDTIHVQLFSRKLVKLAVQVLEALAADEPTHIGDLAMADVRQLARIAEFLVSERLIEAVSADLAARIGKCRSAEEVCESFRIACDMTAEERDEALNEAPWTPIAEGAEISVPRLDAGGVVPPATAEQAN